MMEWLKSNWGNLLSALGLIVSLLTLYVAQTAAKAVEAARSDFRRESVQHHMAIVYQSAQEIETFISLAAYPAALVRARDLGKALGYIIRRWEESHLPSTLMVLVESRTQIDLLATRLQRTTSVLSRGEQAKCLNIVQQIAGRLGEEKAAADARVTNEHR